MPADLRVGDVVAVIPGRHYRGAFGQNVTAHIVARLTKTRVVLNTGDWYPRDTLRRRPYDWGAPDHLHPIDDPQVAAALEVEHQNALDTLRALASHLKGGFTLDDLHLVISAAERGVDDQDEAAALRLVARFFRPSARTPEGLARAARVREKEASP